MSFETEKMIALFILTSQIYHKVGLLDKISNMYGYIAQFIANTFSDFYNNHQYTNYEMLQNELTFV